MPGPSPSSPSCRTFHDREGFWGEERGGEEKKWQEGWPLRWQGTGDDGLLTSPPLCLRLPVPLSCDGRNSGGSEAAASSAQLEGLCQPLHPPLPPASQLLACQPQWFQPKQSKVSSFIAVACHWSRCASAKGLCRQPSDPPSLFTLLSLSPDSSAPSSSFPAAGQGCLHPWSGAGWVYAQGSGVGWVSRWLSGSHPVPGHPKIAPLF